MPLYANVSGDTRFFCTPVLYFVMSLMANRILERNTFVFCECVCVLVITAAVDAVHFSSFDYTRRLEFCEVLKWTIPLPGPMNFAVRPGSCANPMQCVPKPILSPEQLAGKAQTLALSPPLVLPAPIPDSSGAHIQCSAAP